ncbi:MAG: hypothetical protein ACFFE5_11205 [Candidatus Thorarchaeota archaeon]
MERNFKTVLIIINLFFVFSIISIPTIIIFAEFGDYGKFNNSLIYKYSSEPPPLEKELNINTDFGIIDINYITEPVDYITEINVSIEMAGPNLNGKTYADFFNIGWENSSSPLNFTLDLRPEMELDFSNLHIVKININVKIRSDIIFDIKALAQIGSLKIAVPMGISVKNIFSNINVGNIFYDFNNNNIEGNITAILNNGNLTFYSKNNHYSQNSKLDFINNRGYSLIDIYQDEEMGTNITGTAKTKSGTIKVVYKDLSENIGAIFILNNKTTFGNEVQNRVVGFTKDFLPLLAGQFYISDDYPAQNNYNFSLFKPEEEGNYIWNLSSIVN